MQPLFAKFIDCLLDHFRKLMVKRRILLHVFRDIPLGGVSNGIRHRGLLFHMIDSLVFEHFPERILVEDIDGLVELNHLIRLNVGIEQFLDFRFIIPIVHRFRIPTFDGGAQVPEPLQITFVFFNLFFRRFPHEFDAGECEFEGFGKCVQIFIERLTEILRLKQKFKSLAVVAVADGFEHLP